MSSGTFPARRRLEGLLWLMVWRRLIIGRPPCPNGPRGIRKTATLPHHYQKHPREESLHASCP
jgi:hypothetical protein